MQDLRFAQDHADVDTLRRRILNDAGLPQDTAGRLERANPLPSLRWLFDTTNWSTMIGGGVMTALCGWLLLWAAASMQ